jgi:hypothetical protein
MIKPPLSESLPSVLYAMSQKHLAKTGLMPKLNWLSNAIDVGLSGSTRKPERPGLVSASITVYSTSSVERKPNGST